METTLHDNFTRLTLLFTGNSEKENLSVTFDLNAKYAKPDYSSLALEWKSEDESLQEESKDPQQTISINGDL